MVKSLFGFFIDFFFLLLLLRSAGELIIQEKCCI